MNETPDLNSYYMIHDTMRRGAVRLATTIQSLRPDQERLHALRWYTDGVIDELHVHHTIEDDVFFPALAARVPTFTHHEASLADDHRRLAELMDELRSSVAALAEGGDWDREVARARTSSAGLADLLDEHLRIEDDDILPLFARHFTAAEYHRLDRQAVKRTGVRRLLFTVPWAVTTADPGRASHLLANGPALIRGIWRLTGARHAARASYALGAPVVAVVR